ncbi:MAG: peptide chain release factor 2 [Planctomycetota bacterium]|nr:peptide chain release factor 2 [Planctomycetota bacterium]MCX8039156.1 peptide chain release factor 2 [Planctomycetota bacterium]MDW8372146.1 peptide chain release factor 2 [Planctomycetota bacterium]
MGELEDRYRGLATRVRRFAELAGIAGKRQRLERLEARMSEADFWADQERAQREVQELKALRSVVQPWQELDQAVRDHLELLALAEAENDQATIAQIAAEYERLDRGYAALELKLALGGKYDANDVFVRITPGAGGLESQDWAEMLFRMYNAYFSSVGWQAELLEMQPGEGAGLKSCTLRVRGTFVYGYLKSEMGTHRLVRISPFDANARRHTSFAAVEVTPELDDLGEVQIDEKDLRIDTYRAGGAGGQHVNKTDSAVRITHLPTGIVVSCQSERSQQQNRSQAMKMLAARLQQLAEAERLEELKALGGERGTIGWGYQIRSYVLMPYQLVKDLRTGFETSQVQKVLDGDLQPFLDAYLRWVIAGRPDRRAQIRDAD